MTAVNAFDWKAYTEEEHAKRGDPFKQIKRNAVISANVTEGIHKIRKKKSEPRNNIWHHRKETQRQSTGDDVCQGQKLN